MALGNMRQFVKLSKYLGFRGGFVPIPRSKSYSGLALMSMTSRDFNGNTGFLCKPPALARAIQTEGKVIPLVEDGHRSNYSHGESDSGNFNDFNRFGWRLLLAGGVLIGGNLLLTWGSPVEAATRKDLGQKESPAEIASSMFLYWVSGSPPCWRVMLTLEEKGLRGYPNKLLNMSKKEHKSVEVTKLNPRGQVPTFKHGDNVVNESLAIVDYLEASFPNLGTKLIPDEPSKKALVLQRKYEALNLFSKGIEGHFFYTFASAENKTKGEEKAKLQAFRNELDAWENIFKQMGPNNYVAGKDFSIADVVFFPTIALMWRLGLKLEKYPNIKAYFEKTRQRKAVQETWPPHWKDGPNQKYLEDV